MKVKRLIPIVLSLLMVGTLFAGCSNSGDKPEGDTGNQGDQGGNTGDQGGDKGNPLPAENKIYVVGDSTVCDYTIPPQGGLDDAFLPRYGFGTQLYNYFNVTSDQIVNLAISGKSSKSFVTEENYTTLTSSIGKGDYLIIGFGHNDEKSAESARFTDPEGTKDVENTTKGTSFKWSLYQNYIKVATDKGATPILCTPIVRYSSTADYSGAKAHITPDGDYPKAIRELGKETGTTVIDLTALTKTVYSVNNEAAAYYHSHSSYAGEILTTPYDGTETPDGRDDTHINKFGAKLVAYQFANALSITDCPLKAHLKANLVKPTKATDYMSAIKMDYVKPDYVPFDATKYPDNKLCSITTGTTTVDWYKTAMGSLGGATKVEQYTTTYENNKFSVKTGSGSKFASSEDGFGGAFVQIAEKDNFTASAHVKVTAVGESVAKQAGFGMMLRDDILVDTHDKSLKSNYVATGLVTSEGGVNAIWSRVSNTLTKKTNKTTYKLNQEYDVSIERIGQTVNVTFKDGTNTYNETFTDIKFTIRDGEYMYLCLFANRTFNVEFSNVKFEYKGESQGA